MRLEAACPIVCLLILPGAAGAATITLGSLSSSPPSQTAESALTLFDGQLDLTIVGGANRKIEIYPPSTPVSQRAKRRCLVTLSKGSFAAARAEWPTNCAGLFEVTSTKEFAVSFEGQAAYGILRLTVPPAHSNAEATTVIEREMGSHELHWENWTIPEAILLAPGTTRAFYYAAGWHAVPLTERRLDFSDAAKAFLESHLAPGGASSMKIYLSVIDPKHGPNAVDRSFVVTIKEKKPTVIPKDPPPFEDLCMELVEEDRSPGADWYYVVCVDQRDAKRQGVITRARRGNCIEPTADSVPSVDGPSGTSSATSPKPSAECVPKEPDAERLAASGYHLRVNRRVVVYAWYPSDAIDLDAKFDHYGFSSKTYAHEIFKVTGETVKAAAAETKADEGIVKRYDRDPLPGGERTLTVSYATMDGTTKITHELEKRYLVERMYDSAWRIGFGLSWAPWIRTFDVVPQDNGSVVAVTDGDGSLPGIGSFELMLGYSWYFADRTELDGAWGLGWYFGVGVAEIGAETKLFSSIMTGPEIAKGHNYSVVATFGVRRYERLGSQYAEGQGVAAATTLDLQQWVSPAFALVVNFSPNFLKAAGEVTTLHKGAQQ